MKKNTLPKLICNKCGKEQKRNEKESNENWNVFDVNKRCKCGGKFEIKFEKDK